MKWIATVTGLLLSASAFAASPSAAGSWTIDGAVQGVTFTDVCTLTVKDTAITGSCKNDLGKVHDVTGTVNAKTVTFSHPDEYQGDPLTLTFTGTLAEDSSMKGTVDVQPQNVTGEFTAKRTPAPATP